uniref:Uncharacterized protein TCIL3000_10_4660 n=1 Tax=Trypanosoma congolense (strain IL3000) TaxID=1068625 RepID=G0UWD7_TRYCI|nr:unnamed protein product [Trypanosoma congolense IL3000]
MKARRRHGSVNVELPFTYALFSAVDICEDDLLDFTGSEDREKDPELKEFRRKRDSKLGRSDLPSHYSSYIHFKSPCDSVAGTSIVTDCTVNENGNFARVDDEAQHIWLISKRNGETAPSALKFSTAGDFLLYTEKNSLSLPKAPRGSPTASNDPVSVSDVPAKWLDIQTVNRSVITDILSHFPISTDTVDHCCYPDDVDRIVAHSALGYFYFNLMCTPITANCNRRSIQPKSVIQHRLEAVMSDLPMPSFPASVAVSVILFPDWIVTVHEKPFHELDDLLRFILINCANISPIAHNQRVMQVMTAPFIFASLFQIVVGHLLDSESLTTMADRIGDLVFLSKHDQGGNEEVVQRITNVRRCFTEYAAELTRREYIVNLLLQTHMMDSFLTRDEVVFKQLESAQGYLQRMSDEVGDCRDTVALTNWYQNVNNMWQLLQYGNKALRQTILFTELINIMYPIITFQTVFSLNVPVPFGYYEESGAGSLNAFFVIMGIVLFFMLLCGRAMYALWHKRRWSTRLLAS